MEVVDPAGCCCLSSLRRLILKASRNILLLGLGGYMKKKLLVYSRYGAAIVIRARLIRTPAAGW
jgi:hypothetical protein